MSELIIGFDGWTEGAHHYERLVSDLRKHDYRLKLIHFGSYGHDVNRPMEEKIGELDVFDIGYYPGMGLKKILVKERPVAVIFLSTQSFLHRAVNRYCMKLNIPTLHLYHGLVTVQAVESDQPDRYEFIPHLKLILIRATKNIFRIIPIYIKSLIETGAPRSDWIRLWYDIKSKILARHIKVASADATTSMCAVYAESDVEHAHSTYQIPFEQIRVVGNPDLIKFGLESDDILLYFSGAQHHQKIVYIDHGGSTSGFTFKSKNDFIEFIERTSRKLEELGLTLVVKLHPAQAKTDTERLLLDRGIVISTDESFTKDLSNARAVITGPSSASIIPATYGMTIILAQYDQFWGQEYGDVLMSYPKSLYLKKLDDIAELLASEPEVEIDAMRDWIRSYVSPLPAYDMPSRVVQGIMDIVKSK